MAGFLDPRAPSIEAEYARYLDADILGKIVFKNFLIHRAGAAQAPLHIPLGRYGDRDESAPAVMMRGSSSTGTRSRSR
jgi:hypothetical protein